VPRNSSSLSALAALAPYKTFMITFFILDNKDNWKTLANFSREAGYVLELRKPSPRCKPSPRYKPSPRFSGMPSH
jgi:hypothetical protein